jgi:hypothetical protein
MDDGAFGLTYFPFLLHALYTLCQPPGKYISSRSRLSSVDSRGAGSHGVRQHQRVRTIRARQAAPPAEATSHSLRWSQAAPPLLFSPKSRHLQKVFYGTKGGPSKSGGFSILDFNRGGRPQRRLPIEELGERSRSADSGRCRSAFRAHADHSFRAMSISDSGGCRSLVPERSHCSVVSQKVFTNNLKLIFAGERN